MNATPRPGPPPWQLSFDDAQLLAAWLLVLNAVSIDDSRSLSIVAMRQFGRHDVVSCAPCLAAGVHGVRRMPITAAHAHREHLSPGPQHHLVLCAEAIAVRETP